MRSERVAELFRVRERFIRSVHLERDFRDANALRGYVITPHGRAGLNRLAEGLAPESGQRAWRITGDYGSGKSSFALALAHLLSNRDSRLPEQLRQVVDFRRIGGRPNLFPILVTGSRAPLAVAIVAAIRRSLEETSGRGKPAKVLEHARSLEATSAKTIPSDAKVLQLIEDLGAYLTSTSKASGILLIVDELGKFLEFAAMHPDRQDVYFLQALAEAATRSQQIPLFVVGILHQGFNAYADHLSEHAQREWEKVAGRFEEMVFDQPLEQTSTLVADALGVRTDALPGFIARQAREDMDSAVAMGWYGPSAPAKGLRDLAPRLYPLHPTVLPVLARLFHRFGQNERSLFSFLFSSEPSGLRSFAEQSTTADGFYRIHHLYDYARVCFGQRLSVQSYRSHWNHIESVVESFPVDGSADIRVLKTIGLLNLIDTQPLLASDVAIHLSVAAEQSKSDVVKVALRRLQKEKRVIHYRGAGGGYCLWPHTSVNLDKAYRDAERAISPTPRVASLIESTVDPRPLVARRHYIETGNLRYFRVRYAAVSDLPRCIEEPLGQADGMILVALCETPQERDEAMSFARSAPLADRPEVLVAIPAPLSTLRGLVLEAQRWEWVATHVPELGNDRYAAEEVSRQVAASRRALNDRVQAFLGLGKSTASTELLWFRQHRAVPIENGLLLLRKLSTFCDEIFDQAPRVKNELLNRHDLSSAAAAARMRLIERLLSSPTLPLLGMDETKKPPEMSMYLSVLKHGGLHRETTRGFDVLEPLADSDELNLLPALGRIFKLLTSNPDGRVRVTAVFAELARPPYGVRAGLAPLLLAAFAAIHEEEVAFYSNDAFVRRISGQDFMRLVKSPESFEIQFCRVTGVRAVLFAQLSALLNADRPEQRADSLLDVVRTLCVFAAQLPTFTHKTRRLTATAIAVRDALIAAREPANLIFRDLPKACGFEPFRSDASAADRVVRDFVSALKTSLEELKAAYPEMLQRMKEALASAFDSPGSFDDVRRRLASTADRLLSGLFEPKLKAFCLRLQDRALGETEWLESLGSFICEKPPAKWFDADVDQFCEELQRMVGQFRRVEAAAFSNSPNGSSAIRVAVTLADGNDLQRVVYLNESEEARASVLEAQVANLFTSERRVALVGALRAIWKELRVSPDVPSELKGGRT
jgi:hypothetical protein